MVVHKGYDVVEFLQLKGLLLELFFEVIELLVLLSGGGERGIVLGLEEMVFLSIQVGLSLVLIPYLLVRRQLQLKHLHPPFQIRSHRQFPPQLLLNIRRLLNSRLLRLTLLFQPILQPLDLPLHLHHLFILLHYRLSQHQEFLPQV